MDQVKEIILKEKLKKLPTLVLNLVYLGNYIENIKKIKPVHARLYFVYYRYFFDKSIEMPAIVDILLTYKDIWRSAKKLGYFFLNKEYYLPNNVVVDFLKNKNKIGLEDIYYTSLLLEGLNSTSLAIFLTLVKNSDNINKYAKDNEIKYYIEKFEKLGLIDRRKGFSLTSKGWKLVYLIKDMLNLLGEKDLLRELRI